MGCGVCRMRLKLIQATRPVQSGRWKRAVRLSRLLSRRDHGRARGTDETTPCRKSSGAPQGPLRCRHRAGLHRPCRRCRNRHPHPAPEAASSTGTAASSTHNSGRQLHRHPHYHSHRSAPPPRPPHHHHRIHCHPPSQRQLHRHPTPPTRHQCRWLGRRHKESQCNVAEDTKQNVRNSS
mgnify:CR=1 FL=1